MTPTRSYINSRPAWKVKNNDLSNVCYLGTFREVTLNREAPSRGPTPYSNIPYLTEKVTLLYTSTLQMVQL